MKIVFVASFLALLLAADARASGPITVEITTTEAGVRYRIEKSGLLLEGDPRTVEEIEAWLRRAIEAIGDREMIFIHPDDRTSFKTVLEMLHRFKAAGVKRFAIWVRESDGSQNVLAGSLDNIRLQRIQSSPPPK